MSRPTMTRGNPRTPKRTTDDETLLKMDLGHFAQLFTAEYGRPPRIFSAPGRVNLIGDHTDYNDGFALPIAIDRRTYVAARERTDRVLSVRSIDLDDRATIELDRLPSPQHGWRAYVEGVARTVIARNPTVPGADLLVASEVPIGAGLSSSAALEMAVALALTSLGRAGAMSALDLALAAQAAEHTFVGTRCGIMDQLAAAFGRSDRALLLDCRSLAMKEVACALSDAAIVVCDTGVRHELASSAYNERRRECESSVALLRSRRAEIRALRDVAWSEIEAAGTLLAEPLRRRCRHVISENERTLAAAEALSSGDLVLFGELMSASHRSLQADYEVSSSELDCCVEAATATPGVYGARMTGGGFGGCAIALVAATAADRLATHVDRALFERFGRHPGIFSVRASEGMKEHS
jgi:galactokinase